MSLKDVHAAFTIPVGEKPTKRRQRRRATAKTQALPCARCGEGERRPASSYCLTCNRELNRESRMRNPVYRLIYEWKSGPCVDCGVELPAEVMEADHVRGHKKFGLATHRARTATVEEIEEELAKCERRCPNCHRLRHYGEWNGA